MTAEVIKQENPDVLIIAAGASHTTFQVPGGDQGNVLTAGKLHKQLKFFLKFFSPMTLEKLTKIWMPVGKTVAVTGGTLHGCELTEFLTKRNRKVTMVHNGPKKELGEGMTIDDLENLWPWLEKKGVLIDTDVKYVKVTNKGLVIAKDGKERTVEAANICTSQDFAPNNELVKEIGKLVKETYNIGSSCEPGLIVDAMRDGAKIGLAV